MRVFENPASFFFRNADHPPIDCQEEAKGLMNKLQDQQTCILCLQSYNFSDRVPRILIHCGHTLCQDCISKFHYKNKVRCPKCHKLVKHISDIKCLPINHSIFSAKVRALQEMHPNENFQDPSSFLLEKFQEAARKIKEKNAMPMVDPQTGLPFCLTHNDRIEHFFCTGHKVIACRVCVQMCHQSATCQIIELYDVENIDQFLLENSQATLQSSMMDFFEEEI